MITPGQILLMEFPQSDLSSGKLRPVLIIKAVKGDFKDWVVCMVSSQVRQAIQGFDEIVVSTDGDFPESGLKVDSVIRVGRLFTAHESVFKAVMGTISQERLQRVQNTLSTFFKAEPLPDKLDLSETD
ncbi:type II toxin-antitoxin system PemK/MazF family toxin [Deltaproteobacteria bacterium TL4]